MAQVFTDDHFRQFAGSLEKAIEQYEAMPEETLVERQKKQIEELVSLEKEFRLALIAHPRGPGVYKEFIKMIKEDRGNVLAARPYFRERQEIFGSGISSALKAGSEKSLYQYHFNYQFVLFAMKARKWRKGTRLISLARKIADLRKEIVTMNLPLAIHQARLFFSKTPQAQLQYMDLVQIACEGLMAAVDKFVLPYSPVFRSVAIGRMSGNFIANYSETLLHFYPQDRKRLYRANKVIHKYKGGEVDFEKLAADVNKDVEPDKQIAPEEIADLMAAASTVSVDAVAPGCDEDMDTVERYPADESVRPDVQVEDRQAYTSLWSAVASLTLIEKKVLRLKGVDETTILGGVFAGRPTL